VALKELCTKRRWEGPTYTLVDEGGPSHQKYFMLEVNLNNQSYKPEQSSGGKKAAKKMAALKALTLLGIKL
jgi:dsRNA-specific ribonuclease